MCVCVSVVCVCMWRGGGGERSSGEGCLVELMKIRLVSDCLCNALMPLSASGIDRCVGSNTARFIWGALARSRLPTVSEVIAS